VLGQDAYPDLETKAAAVLHSLARNRTLVDGNKRLAWLATYVFLAKNGVVAVAASEIDDVGEIAATLRTFAG
jgi:death on curing protein